MKKILLLLSFTFLFLSLSSAQSWPAGIHDPSSIVKDGDTYYIFGTGDGIRAMRSTDLVTWSTAPSPFPTDFPQWILNYASTDTDQFDGNFWAPDIIHMNGKYYLYYSCSVWGTMSSCIGVVVNETLDPASPDYEWVDQGDIGVYSNIPYINGIDPSLMRGPDGKVWLTYGSFNRDGIVITEVDTITGAPKTTSRYSIANSYTGGGRYGEGEGGCVMYRDGYYYLFYNKGGCCNGIASTYYMVMGRSTNPKGPYYDKNNKPLRVLSATSGGTVVFRHDNTRGEDDRYFGPGHFGLFTENGTDYVTFHYYDPNGYYPSAEANYKGGPTLGLAKLEWGEDGWPEISMDFLEEGIYEMENVNSSKVMDVYSHRANNGSGLFQYAPDPIYPTQKWIFTPLGTGEYTIQNYSNPELYLEATGAENDESLRITADYNGAVNQKFRLVKGANEKVILYPSTKDAIMEIPNAITINYAIKLWSNTNHDCQRWYASSFEESLDLSHSNIVFDHQEAAYDTIIISGNAAWTLSLQDTTWMKVSPASGYATDTLYIELDMNMDEERSNILTVSTNGGLSEDIFIYQKGDPDFVKNQLLEDITIYPNPVNDKININSQYPVQVEILDLSGKRIKQFNPDQLHIISMGEMESGVYIFKLRSEKGTTIRKIIKL